MCRTDTISQDMYQYSPKAYRLNFIGYFCLPRTKCRVFGSKFAELKRTKEKNNGGNNKNAQTK